MINGEVDLKTPSECLRKAHGLYFVKCYDILQSGNDTDVVFEFMSMSLVQIVGAPRPPTEQEVLAIVGQVRV
jgi:hypothetical protein